MAVVATPFVHQANAHPASVLRQMLQAVMGSPIGSFSGGAGSTAGFGGHGISGPDDLKVTQNGTPNMSVNVAQGLGFIRGTESQHQGVYAFYNDATLNVSIAAADPTNGRRDLIVADIRDSEFSGSDDDVRIRAVTGTPAGSPADPAVPANALVLARVTVGAAVSTITNANITDLRRRASALGGVNVCTSTTRPSAPYAGQVISETDGNRKSYVWNGTAWRPYITSAAVRAYKTTDYAAPTGVGGTAVPLNAERFDTDGFHDTVTNNTRLTIPSHLAGLYTIGANLQVNASALGTFRLIYIKLNGTTVIAQEIVSIAAATNHCRVSMSTIYQLSNSDYVELFVEHDAGSDLTVAAAGNYSPELFLAYLGPA